MLLSYLEIGQITGTHGVRGEMRVNPFCDSPDFFKQFKTLYFDDKGEKSIKVTSRPHGNIVLLKIEGIDTVEKAQALRGKHLYMKRSDARLKEGSYFIAELIGCIAVDSENNDKVYGTLTDVSYTGANDVWHITDENGREYLVPVIDDVVINADVAANRVYLNPLKGIFDDED